MIFRNLSFGASSSTNIILHFLYFDESQFQLAEQQIYQVLRNLHNFEIKETHRGNPSPCSNKRGFLKLISRDDVSEILCLLLFLSFPT